ncbi:MAG: hypothetical protein LIO39_05315, partial [Lachnospiraceae bacterium]|nr:hypothetical protein [Lachnospiraceae bacterium]
MSIQFESKKNTETQQEIRCLEALLPKAKAKVMAVLWMTVISAVLLVGSTYAWVTLSTNPEVSGVSTTVTGNGSLEIALSGSEGTEPATSAVGDSSAVQDMTVSNLTWGNLVNLSDSSYGLEDLVIYPSRLNDNYLRTNPLLAAGYGTDGRVSTLNASLRYATWNETQSLWQIIGSTPEYGVRAVGTVQTSSTGAADMTKLIETAQIDLALAEDAYAAVTSSNSGYMEELVAMVGDYLDYKINAGDAPDFAEYTEDIYNMYLDLRAAANELGDAYVAIAEIYQYSEYGADEGTKNYTPYTLADLKGKTEAEWEAEGITLTGWDSYLALLTRLETDTEKAKSLYNSALSGNAVLWADVKPVLEELFPYSTANYIYKGDGSSTTYSWTQIQSMWVIIDFLCFPETTTAQKAGKVAYVELTEGLLYDFEELISYSMNTDVLEAHFTYQAYFGDDDLYIQMKVSTTSTANDVPDAISGSPEDTEVSSEITTAGETYGMAIDLWVRTNAEGTTYLVLDGAVTKDSDGNITGYEGSNRIWTEYDDSMIYGTSSTQGSGSCYVFYYSSAEERVRVLNMLEAMSVVFYNTQTGTKLATAGFDTDNCYEDESGRVTVPLTVDNSGSNVYKEATGETTPVLDENGNETGEYTDVTNDVYYVAALNQNEAVPITALLYLDGTVVTNAEASSAADFTGLLNLQFASTANLTTAGAEDGDLYNESVSVTAQADVTEHTWGDNSDDMTTTVTLTVNSSETYSDVTAAYGRQINEGSQALRQGEVAFEKSNSSDTEWTMTYTFPSAGTYVLTHVSLDGV